MTALDDVVAAIRSADDDGWAIADAIARIPRRGEAGYVTNEGIARYIGTKHPVEYSAGYVSQMRGTADAFPANTRVLAIPFAAHRLMRAHPDKLLDWVKRNPGKSLSAAEADKLRPKSTPANTTGAASVQEQAGNLFDKLDRLAELEPALLVDLASRRIDDWTKRYAARIEKGHRGLTAVS
jgi:hypothetical protein